jgi:hypothetical protein
MEQRLEGACWEGDIPALFLAYGLGALGGVIGLYHKKTTM